MSNASIIDEVQKIESTIKEEIGKTAMLLRDQFHQQLFMERQDRQSLVAEFRRDLEAQRALIGKVEEQLVAQQAAFQKLQQDLLDQQRTASQERMQNQLMSEQLSAAKEDCQTVTRIGGQFSSKVTAVETTLGELQKSLEKVQQEAARQSSVQQDILQQQAVAVDLHLEGGLQDDQIQELRRDLNAQRNYLSEQSSKFTAMAAEGEETKLKLRVVESLLDETRVSVNQKVLTNPGAPALEDHSMQSELHSHFVGLKETVAQLRTDFAVQSTMHQELLVQQAGLESLRQDVSKLKLGTPPTTVTMNMGLQDIIHTLRAEFDQKVTSLEQKTQAVLSMSTGENAERAERMNKLVEGSQSTNSSDDKVAEVRQLVQEMFVCHQQMASTLKDSKDSSQRDSSLKQIDSSLKQLDLSSSAGGLSGKASTSDAASDAMRGADVSGREQPEGLASVGGACYSLQEEARENPEFISSDLKLALNSLVERIQDTVNADPTARGSRSPVRQTSHAEDASGGSIAAPARLTSSGLQKVSMALPDGRSMTLPQGGASRSSSAVKATRGRPLVNRSPPQQSDSTSRLPGKPSVEPPAGQSRSVSAISAASVERKPTRTYSNNTGQTSKQSTIGQSDQSGPPVAGSVGGSHKFAARTIGMSGADSMSPQRRLYPSNSPAPVGSRPVFNAGQGSAYPPASMAPPGSSLRSPGGPGPATTSPRPSMTPLAAGRTIHPASTLA